MKHPFAEEVIEKKRAYVIGVAIVVLETGEITTKQEDYLEKLLENLGLESVELGRILKVAKGYQTVKDKVLNLLDAPYKRNCFLMELYSLFYQTTEKEPKFVKDEGQFVKLLGITQTEFNFIEEVYKGLVYKNELYLSQISKRCEAEQTFLGKEVLNYFFEDESFTCQEERILQKGEELIITKPYKIMGVLKVLEGARLIFEGAKVELHAPIQVEGGYLEIRNTQFKAHADMNKYMFTSVNTTVHITGSSFDGNRTTGIWCQANGELFLENSYFRNTAYKSCMNLWECQARIRGCTFTNCQTKKNSGGAIYTNSNLEVIESSFEGCKGYNGAAIYRMSTVVPWVEEKRPDKKRIGSRRKDKEENKMLQLFGKKVDFVPIPKKLGSVSYGLILQNNHFLRCEAYKKGIVGVYKTQVVVDKNNLFEDCVGKSIYFYEM